MRKKELDYKDRVTFTHRVLLDGERNNEINFDNGVITFPTIFLFPQPPKNSGYNNYMNVLKVLENYP